jgi:hypothetical protein
LTGILPAPSREHKKGTTMSFLDIYLIVLFLALVGLLVVKFRG